MATYSTVQSSTVQYNLTCKETHTNTHTRKVCVVRSGEDVQNHSVDQTDWAINDLSEIIGAELSKKMDD